MIASAVAASLLAGCRVGPKYQRPPALAQAPPATYKESPQNFTGSDAWKVAQPQDAALHGKWWEIFNDAELNSLEEKVDVDNQNIKLAFQNYMARAPSSQKLGPNCFQPSPLIRHFARAAARPTPQQQPTAARIPPQLFLPAALVASSRCPSTFPGHPICSVGSATPSASSNTRRKYPQPTSRTSVWLSRPASPSSSSRFAVKMRCWPC